jgi:hypothetical protein
MLHHVAVARTNISEEYITSIIRVTRICDLGTMLAVTSSRSTLCSLPILVTMMEVIYSSEILDLSRATWHNIPEDGIVHSHHCENLKSYKAKMVLFEDVTNFY